MATKLSQGQVVSRVYEDFAGGVNLYLGPRQVADNESPNATDCDFKGKGGIGNRQGYTQVGTNSGATSGIYGLTEYHTSTLDQLVKFASNGSNVAAYYSTGGTWTAATGSTLTDAKNVDTVQAVSSSTVPYTGVDGTLFTFNGTDGMLTFNGSAMSSYAAGSTLLYGAYFDSRLWGVNPTYRDTLYFSTKTPDATKPLDFTSNGTSNFGTVTFTPGSGTEITGIKVFKNALYVLTRKEIYSLTPASTANTFTVTLVTAAIGCVSHRSIAIVENDMFFASIDGVYALGEVSTFVSVRNSNKSLRIQRIFDSLTGPTRKQLVGRYFNYKYHLFYSLYGGPNDSCMVYDIRYQAWQDWRNIAGNDATAFTDSTKTTRYYFGHPSTGAVYQLYSGATTDDGTAINSIWYSKSFDEGIPSQLKLYFYSDFVFGLLNGSVSVSVIFNDSVTTATSTITQQNPQGGFGQTTFGRSAFGGANNTVTVSSVINLPLRLKAKGQRFAVQYMVSSTGTWRLDAIGQALLPMSTWKFPASQKLN